MDFVVCVVGIACMFAIGYREDVRGPAKEFVARNKKALEAFLRVE